MNVVRFGSMGRNRVLWSGHVAKEDGGVDFSEFGALKTG